MTRNFELPGRSPVRSTGGMAATSHPLATSTALDVLRRGGNAVDAAVAACAVLCVAEPQSTGIGGDCFALIAPAGSGRVIAYNGSGRSPSALTLEGILAEGMDRIPGHSPHAVTVPGAVDAWARLTEDHGRRDFAELLQPAIRMAEDGCPVHDRVAFDWRRWQETLAPDPNSSRIFTPGGKAPAAGSLHRQPLLAATLRRIARKGKDGFYRGEVARDIVAYLRKLGGLHTLEDFATARGEYVEPIRTGYRGFDVFECPPNGQGITALILLNILKGFDLDPEQPLSAERLHLEIEAARLAYGDRNDHVADPLHHAVPVAHLLSEDHAQALRGAIDMHAAGKDFPSSLVPRHADTVYLCVVDRDLNAVSFINSLFTPFGSGLTSPGSGVLLQNRGIAFSLDPHHPNRLAGGKRPLHTIIPGMLFKDGEAVMPFGVMGGQYQAAGHAHFLTNFVDFRLDVQQALDAGRVFPLPDGRVEAEAGIPPNALEGLRRRGHVCVSPFAPIGGGQAVWIDRAAGVLTGGSDPRKDGCALGY